MGGRGSWSNTYKTEGMVSIYGKGEFSPSEKLNASQFQHMNGNKASSEATLKKIEDKISKNSYESGFIIDDDGFVHAAYKGGSHAVSFTDGKSSDYSKLKGNIVTHNHPSGGALFSKSDLMLGFKYGVKELRATTRKGTASLRAASNHPDWQGLMKAYESSLGGGTTIKNGQKWLRNNAYKYGFVFKLIK